MAALRSSRASTYQVLRFLVLGLARAAPLHLLDDEAMPTDDPGKWVYLGTAVALVLLGGAFAGLTIALMGQDEIYLQVIATSGDKSEKKSAAKVLRLLKRGKHWVLVTLLLSNVITNETLPIVLDRSLGGGWPAVLSSTILIVIFGEIIPQSICVRFGLPIGAWMSPVVLALMFIMAPVAWPTARLLDWLLGEDHGTTYKKAGLKTLVTLHKSIGPTPSDRLNEDEVTIISAVLDLKDKPVGRIMTPMSDVFTLSADDVLDETVMGTLSTNGYSRIPVHEPGNPSNFMGMLLVKMLITYDPEDELRVRDFALATLPETRPETSCLDIINFFQEGKSHMVLVSDFPGEPIGALGVVTLEDVIEELIGEEIVDESDVFVDVHKAIRRLTPAPRTRVPKGEIVSDRERSVLPDSGAVMVSDVGRKGSLGELGKSPKSSKPVTFLMRRRSDGTHPDLEPTAVRSDAAGLKDQLRHLGPSNAASRPKTTRISSVKIKHGDGKADDETVPLAPKLAQGGATEGLINAGRDAKDGTHALQQGYGTMSQSLPKDFSRVDENGLETVPEAPVQEATQSSPSPPVQQKVVIEVRTPSMERSPDQQPQGAESHSQFVTSRSSSRRADVRSGSITESTVDRGGVKKLILETTSSSEEGESASPSKGHLEEADDHEPAPSGADGKSNKKQRRKRGGKKNRKKGGKGGDEPGDGEHTPLLGGK